MCKAARLEVHLTRRSVSRDLTEAKEFFSQTDVAIEASATALPISKFSTLLLLFQGG